MSITEKEARKLGLVPPIQPRPPRGMNPLEQRYAEHLRRLAAAGEIMDWRFEALRLRLAEGSFFKPDFLVIRKECVEIVETKGYWREAARVRMRVAAEKYPWFRWRAVQWKDGWVYEDFGASRASLR